ncbi:hypothetical protein [Nocardia sp. MDA0666]|uniref:hypothetical protein n=1 Tax=Nocardia sp. MDA0666 TaxID=2135448 RepID=UPI001304E2C2|nr:hypothetical protein [Nocardia sp. MDA0666]
MRTPEQAEQAQRTTVTAPQRGVRRPVARGEPGGRTHRAALEAVEEGVLALDDEQAVAGLTRFV